MPLLWSSLSDKFFLCTPGRVTWPCCAGVSLSVFISHVASLTPALTHSLFFLISFSEQIFICLQGSGVLPSSLTRASNAFLTLADSN